MGRFDNVSCSQCGRMFGPGDSGYSHCKDHLSDRGSAATGLRAVYKGKDGTLSIRDGNYGFWARFVADDPQSPGVRLATFGNGHATKGSAVADAVRQGVKLS